MAINLISPLKDMQLQIIYANYRHQSTTHDTLPNFSFKLIISLYICDILTI